MLTTFVYNTIEKYEYNNCYQDGKIDSPFSKIITRIKRYN